MNLITDENGYMHIQIGGEFSPGSKSIKLDPDFVDLNRLSDLIIDWNTNCADNHHNPSDYDMEVLEGIYEASGLNLGMEW